MQLTMAFCDNSKCGDNRCIKLTYYVKAINFS